MLLYSFLVIDHTNHGLYEPYPEALKVQVYSMYCLGMNSVSNTYASSCWLPHSLR